MNCRIKSACLKQGLKEPFIEESGDFVGVRFFKECTKKGKNISESIGKVSESIGKVSEQEKIILKYLDKHKKITSSNVRELLAVKEARARRVLKEMVEKNYIVRQGLGKNTFYIEIVEARTH